MTAMRIISWFNPSTDEPAAIRARLLTLPGVSAVACRNARYWQAPEFPCDRVHAPSYPGIRAAYAACGIVALDAPAEPEPPLRVEELVALPAAAVVTVVAHGKYASEELAAHAPEGVVIAVNQAWDLLPRADYVVANDGWTSDMAHVHGDFVKVCRRSHHSSLGSGPWFALDRLGVSSGLFSVRCALRLAHQALCARRIVLIGHDCLPGKGAVGGAWTAAHIESCRRETEADLRALVAAGVEVAHVTWDARRRQPRVRSYADGDA
ncbi:MAG: hypothetical protein RLZZ524_601 [Pseudomonadota bacterium]|jgi:hypothetical protein